MRQPAPVPEGATRPARLRLGLLGLLLVLEVLGGVLLFLELVRDFDALGLVRLADLLELRDVALAAFAFAVSLVAHKPTIPARSILEQSRAWRNWQTRRV